MKPRIEGAQRGRLNGAQVRISRPGPTPPPETDKLEEIDSILLRGFSHRPPSDSFISRGESTRLGRSTRYRVSSLGTMRSATETVRDFGTYRRAERPREPRETD